MNHSFHGRTLGSLSVTGNDLYREPFESLIPNIKFVDYNDIESFKHAISDKTCAVILETIQGEGGIYPAIIEYLKEVRNICDEKDIIMILDEVQCGMGRTGKMFAYQNYGILPDVLTVAKGLGCGVPIGAFLCRGKTKVYWFQEIMEVLMVSVVFAVVQSMQFLISLRKIKF